MRKKERDQSLHLQVHQVHHHQDLQWTQMSFIEEN
jgi:hypothetical protein